MPRELKLYDPAATPAAWTARMASGEHAVLHLDPRTETVVAPSGRGFADPLQATCLVFESLPEARAYAEARVEQAPPVRCDVYDQRGKSREPLRVLSRAAQRQGRRTVRTLTAVGAVMIVAGLGLCAWDYGHDWLEPLHSAVGTKLLVAGMLLFVANVLRLGERTRA